MLEQTIESTVDLAEAAERLEELAEAASNGTEFVLTRGDRPVARLVAAEPARSTHDGDDASADEDWLGHLAHDPTAPRATGPMRLGTARGQFVVPDDFDEPLEELEEYT